MEPPFKVHLGQNTCPTDDEILDIRAALKANTRSAQAIDEEIGHILDSVSTLIKKRDAHLDAAKSYSTFLQPIRRTPDDILSVIFQACVPQDRLTMTHTHPAVVISHVCRRWRQLSLSTPQLWSGIHLLLPEHPVRRQPRDLRADFISVKAMDKAIACWDARVDQLFAIAKIWVTRSMEYPLDATLSACRAPSSFDDISKGFYQRIGKSLLLLCGVAHRWRRVRIDLFFGYSRGNEELLLEPLLSLQANDCPALESLRIKGYRIPPLPIPTEPRELLMSPTTNVLRGPALKTLYLDGVCHQWDALPVQWSCITDLRFSCYVNHSGAGPPNHFGVGEALLLLKECHRLVVCDFTIEPSRPGSPPPLFVATSFLPHLKSLTIRKIIPTEEFVHSLSLPSLHTLCLTALITTGSQSPVPGTFHGMAANVSSAMAWLRNLGHQLETVQLGIHNLDAEGVRGLLQCLPSVSELALRFDAINYGAMPMADWEDSGLARALSPTVHGGNTELDLQSVVCPRLRALCCDMRGQPGSMAEESAVDIIIARRRGSGLADTTNPGVVDQLETLEVAFGVPQTLDILEDLRGRRVNLAGFRLDASYGSTVTLRPHQFNDEAYLFGF